MTIKGVLFRIGITLLLPLILMMSFLEIFVCEQLRTIKLSWLEVQSNWRVYRRFIGEKD